MSKTQTNKTGTSKGNISTNTKKRKSPLVLVVIVLFVIIASLVLIFFLNVGNVRNTILDVFAPEASEETVSEQEQHEAQIRDEIIRLNTREDELDERENQLILRENDLNIRQSELEARIQESVALEEQLLPQVEDISRISVMFKSMEAEQAAIILSRMEDLERVILILKGLNNEKAGEILGLVEPEKAATLIERMMGVAQN